MHLFGKKLTVFSFLFVFTLSQFVPLYVASAQAGIAQQFSDENAMLVCSGNTLKWYSKAIYDQTGQLSPVEPPDSVPLLTEHVDCANGLAADFHHGKLFDDSGKVDERHSNSELNVGYHSVWRVSEKFKLAQHRAPPTFG